MDIQEIVAAKRKLEETILGAIRQFENQSNIRAREIHIVRHRQGLELEDAQRVVISTEI